MSTLVVFARAPELGRVKTRLAAALGEAVALRLYTAFLEDSLHVASAAARLAGADLVVATAGDWRDERYAHEPQPDGDLGARMHHFVERYRDGGVCLIGSDAPTLQAAQIVAAFQALRRHEVVIGPSDDGGYWLLGTTRSIPELLTEMPWSTPRVLDETLHRLVGRSVELVDAWYDIDELADVERLRGDLTGLSPDVAPATRAALSRLDAG